MDDQPTIIFSLRSLFGDDYEILISTSGNEAIALCRESRPDLVILDIKMPDLNGLEVCRALKEQPETSNIPIIFLTSSDDDVDEVAGFEVGAADFIHKPVNPVIFKARLLNHLAQKLQADILRDLADSDGLTGIANRRRFEDQFQKEWAHFLRTREPLSLLMIDVDYFKLYNDTYGHLAGDDCLRKVATALSAAIKRPHDFVARFGGEEFVAILPRTDATGAMLIAEKMLNAVRDLKLEHKSSAAWSYVTISIGIADATRLKSLDSFCVKTDADRALYEAKKSGRNKAIAYSV
ncbi:diguanylate cyclase [Herbaspirillum huttiense]|uniref:diguanylate cyclase n=1 Tax=Herbaspirillum huttiense TaxID=863372 RepID=UPI002E79CC1C|nr:diguanylate cyclase [Herbaspirillum huttiense]MEE1635619.1 diguanylate cyclase [Herbaspirillum huttiense NC40101]